MAFMYICIYLHINPGTGLFFSFKTTVVWRKTSDIFENSSDVFRKTLDVFDVFF